MPRQGRQLSESKIYHVMNRGNERKNIFLEDEDKKRFIEILREKNENQKFIIYAYCLMDNHVHLFINEGNDEIGKIMKRINISNAYYFNKKYARMTFIMNYLINHNITNGDLKNRQNTEKKIELISTSNC